MVSGDIAIAVRWLAPESMEATNDGRVFTKDFTPSSNVWSLGVVLWEILEFGKLPYMDLDSNEVAQKVTGGDIRLQQPLTPVAHRDKL